VSGYRPERYRELLREIGSRSYASAGFLEEPAARVPTLYLRHDVDFSLEFAVELARLNAEAGVRATFFVLLRSHAYNLASRRSRELVAELLSLGQRLGFHHWTLDDTAESFAAGARRDFGIAKELVPELEPVFAIHTPTPTSQRLCLEAEVPGLVNASSARFLRGMAYYSDSNLRHSFASWLGIVRRAESPLHLLLHPVNWVAGGTSVVENLAASLAAVVREGEQEVRLNGIWQRALPDGLPPAVYDDVRAVILRGVEGAPE
jgi:hypothetical protein